RFGRIGANPGVAHLPVAVEIGREVPPAMDQVNLRRMVLEIQCAVFDLGNTEPVVLPLIAEMDHEDLDPMGLWGQRGSVARPGRGVAARVEEMWTQLANV